MSASDQAALDPPPGQVSNLIDPPNDTGRAYFTLIFLPAVVLLAVSIRAYAKIFCLKRVSYQDVFALLSLGTFTGFVWALFSITNVAGGFVHQWNVRLSAIPRFFHYTYLGMVFYESTMGTLKVCILSEWIQIFVPGKTRNGFFWAAITILSVNIAYYISSILATSLICPTRATLCEASLPIFVSSASINIVSDFAILVLPIRTIWNLHLPRQKKINISFLFGVGLIACGAAIARLNYAIILLHSPDTTYGISNIIEWVITELTLAYLVFCAPMVPKAFQGNRFMGRFFGASRASRSQDSGTRGFNKHGISSGQGIQGQDPPPRNHRWLRINLDDSDAVPLPMPLQDFHAAAEGGLAAGAHALENLPGVIRVERSVWVDTLTPTGRVEG